MKDSYDKQIVHLYWINRKKEKKFLFRLPHSSYVDIYMVETPLENSIGNSEMKVKASQQWKKIVGNRNDL